MWRDWLHVCVSVCVCVWGCVKLWECVEVIACVWVCVHAPPEISLAGLNLIGAQERRERKIGERLFFYKLNSFLLQAWPCRDLSLYCAVYNSTVWTGLYPPRDKPQRCTQMKRSPLWINELKRVPLSYGLLTTAQSKAQPCAPYGYQTLCTQYWLTFTIRGDALAAVCMCVCACAK